MGNQSKFRVIEKKRKLVTYQITDSEMDNLGSLSKIEQIMLNAIFTCIGAFAGTLVTIFSGAANMAVWAVAWISGLLTVVLLVCYVAISLAMRKIKKDIRDEQ
jgi:predicted exporter